jgi:transketolase
VAPRLILIATGSEVPLALDARLELQKAGIPTRVVSMPCLELFAEQPKEYRVDVLPPAITARLAIEAGVRQGWDRYVGSMGDVICLDRFGASAPVKDVMHELGFNVANVVARARALLQKQKNVQRYSFRLTQKMPEGTELPPGIFFVQASRHLA